jgi:nitrite reductase/ring-hydroxylating ferredoxin subunit
MARVPVGTQSEIPEGAAKIVDVRGTAVAVFHRPEGWFAIANTCTHRGGPLGEGEVEGFVVTCPLHAGQFDIRSGALVSPPPTRPVTSYKVVVEGDTVGIET